MKTKQLINRRAIFAGIGITFLFFVLISRSFYIQSVEATMLKEKAKNIWNRNTTIEPKRGTIFDRNEDRLAYNAPAYTVVAILSNEYKNHVTDPLNTALKLSPILKMEQNDLYTLLTKQAFQVELRPGGWKIDKDTADKIKALNLPGIILKEETKRYYPNNSLAAYVLGFINYDNKAIMGLESQYDQQLRGEPGQLKVMKDLKGYELPDGEELFQPVKDGQDLKLTIDKTIQQYVESALDKAETMYNPKRMVAIVADPHTGEILAMSNRPTFNPNQYWNIENYSNNAINFQFEPGSTFKIVTLAAAIEEGKFNPNETYQSGRIQVPGKVIRDHNGGRGWGTISFLEGVQRSSNVAFVHLGYERLGKEKLFSYINDFGFGQKTGIDLPNESVGIMKDVKQAYPLDVAAMSFGQGVAVTPIQQVMAVSAVANGGKLMQPYLVKEISDPKTHKVIVKNEPIVKKRVISEETAKKTREVLEKVVDFGEKPGYIEGYHVAGKTGTAQKIGPDGKYLKNKNIVSFIGFAPANDPKLIVYVAVDEPDLEIPYYGSTVAAPIFKEIMQNSLRYLKVPIDSNESIQKQKAEIVKIPDFINQPLVNAKNSLIEKQILPIVIGNGKKVLQQFPEKDTEMAKGERAYLITVPKGEWKVPHFIGKSLREVLEISSILDINIQIKGSGIVISQSLSPDTPYQGQKIEVELIDPSLLQ
ncbi:penicillin-binding protein [Tepidibacillus sp. HK-1]|uniref:penicillin-binding protein n=1 Tax=Tepidibacillus sp. HK-1 TaxID=1883407 RepID=UPI000852A290|nr:PASTA domain-containing penicillin-binding protein [Tepidibacillus sp. HK-1]GBF11985.1 stage V sporulation protein D [Tepidibacillus sp. HK-1]